MVENSCSSSTVAWNGLLGESGITRVASVRMTVGTSVIAVSSDEQGFEKSQGFQLRV